MDKQDNNTVTLLIPIIWMSILKILFFHKFLLLSCYGTKIEWVTSVGNTLYYIQTWF